MSDLKLSESDIAWIVRLDGVDGYICLYPGEFDPESPRGCRVKWVRDMASISEPIAVIGVPALSESGQLTRVINWVSRNKDLIQRYWDGDDESALQLLDLTD